MIKVIFWDFDGVLMDSNSIRDLGFESVLKEFPVAQVEQLLEYHRANGGLSRYVKFKYFFEVIQKTQISDKDIMVWAHRFSMIMKKSLVNPELLISETLDFVKNNQENYVMHITSGSDQEELRYLCRSLEIDHLFRSINGSPKPKKVWVNELIETYGYNIDECLLIGDSINDWEAAISNGIKFMAYNTGCELKEKSSMNLIF
jgi:HAD superfamily hydrolase (TIGR01549 family)